MFGTRPEPTCTKPCIDLYRTLYQCVSVDTSPVPGIPGGKTPVTGVPSGFTLISILVNTVRTIP